MLLVFYFFAPFLAYQAGKKSYMVLGILSVFIETVFFMVHKMLDADIRLFYYWPFFVLGMACSGIDISFLLQAAAERGGGKNKPVFYLDKRISDMDQLSIIYFTCRQCRHGI